MTELQIFNVAIILLGLAALACFGVLPLLFVRAWWRERGQSHVMRDSRVDPRYRLAILMANPANIRYLPVNPDVACSRCGHQGAVNAEDTLDIQRAIELYDETYRICRFCLRDLTTVFDECVEVWQRFDKHFESQQNKGKQDERPINTAPPLNEGELSALADCLDQFARRMGRGR